MAPDDADSIFNKKKKKNNKLKSNKPRNIYKITR